MRMIKFRGKANMPIEELDEIHIEHNSGWVYGNLIQNGNQPFIVGDVADSTDEYIALEYWVPVFPESVGQFTGLFDKYQNKIYEMTP